MKRITPFPGTLQKVAVPTGSKLARAIGKIVLDEAQEVWLRRWFPEVENRQLMEASGLSHSTLHRFARQLGLKKSKKGLREIKRRQTAHVKKLCTQNGYYASLKGKQPSEACKQATRKMWQDIRDGKREHPMHVMRRKNPKKYQLCNQRKSETRKELIRKETLRTLYGLERKTKLHIVMCKYTHRQVHHRSNALKRGYILMVNCSEQGGERYNIYYDDDTQRGARFERNLVADGFKVLPLEM